MLRTYKFVIIIVHCGNPVLKYSVPWKRVLNTTHLVDWIGWGLQYLGTLGILGSCVKKETNTHTYIYIYFYICRKIH